MATINKIKVGSNTYDLLASGNYLPLSGGAMNAEAVITIGKDGGIDMGPNGAIVFSSGLISTEAFYLHSDINNLKYELWWGAPQFGNGSFITGLNNKSAMTFSKLIPQFVAGMNCQDDPEKLVIIGNGTSTTARSNALTIDTNGLLSAKKGYSIVGGTSSQFLKADGSVDSNSYLTSSSLSSYAKTSDLSKYIPLSGSSAITGALIPAAKQDIELGSVSCPWNEVYFNTTYTNYISPIYGSNTLEIQSKILSFTGNSGDACGPILSIGDGNGRGLIFEGIIADGVTAEHTDNDNEIVLCSTIFNFVGNLKNDLNYEGSSSFSDTQLMVYGKITVSSGGSVTAPAFYQTSDIRKKDIKEEISLDKCYDLIDKCQTIIYSLKDQTKEQVGMIAQEVEEFFPEVIQTDEEGFKSLDYSRLVVICFKVLKDLIKRVSKLEEK